MGQIQQSINNLIFQTSLLKSLGEKKEKQASSEEKAQLKEARQTELFEQRKGVLEKRNQAAEEKLKNEQAKTQIAEEKLKIEQVKTQAAEEKLKFQQTKTASEAQRLENRKIWGQRQSKRLEDTAQKATQAANEEIQAKFIQKNIFKDRYAQALQRRMRIDEPHKPLPKKEE